MNIICLIEGCGHLAERTGLCATHSREARKKAHPKEKVKRQRISKQSDEGKERMAVYGAINRMFLLMNLECEICGRNSDEVHHKKGRIGDLLYDVRFFLPVCRICHDFIEKHPETAYMNGWSLLRNTNEPHTI